ncbi:MAG: 2-aminoethylphosphonate--pyruvate transaminase [Alphaproteobacteria bacterium]
MPAPRSEPLLLTPGPLTTSRTTKEAMLRDWGSRDHDFIELNARVRMRLVEIAGGAGTHVSIPLQGSGTFAVEAAVGTFVPRDGKLLVLVNGGYGRRIAKICGLIGRAYRTLETPEDVPPTPAEVEEALAADPDLTHVAIVHCETTTGLLNPLPEVADVAARRGRGLLIDAMSSFGALPLDAREVRFDAVVASANKCLEGVPGVGFVIARTEALERSEGNAPSLSLDLYDQWRSMEANGQWRFTPPTHVLAAFDQALEEHADEGGVGGRGARYQGNLKVLVEGMREMGFETFLPDELQAPVIVTFHMPEDPNFRFAAFYDELRKQGYVIYPGKLAAAESFRIGCIGRLDEADMRGVLAAIREVLETMGVTRCGPARAAAATA